VGLQLARGEADARVARRTCQPCLELGLDLGRLAVEHEVTKVEHATRAEQSGDPLERDRFQRSGSWCDALRVKTTSTASARWPEERKLASTTVMFSIPSWSARMRATEVIAGEMSTAITAFQH